MSDPTPGDKCFTVKITQVDLVEQAVFNPPAGMEGWRNYRVEYCGHAEDCAVEGSIWLPANANPDAVEQLIMGMQAYWKIWSKE
jgi:hypothetical protein